MNEPKKRGRPTNAEIAAREAAKVLPSVALEIAQCGVDPRVLEEAIRNRAEAYALRVWHGQSESADRSWRVQRVKEALEGQGLPFEGVELPDGVDAPVKSDREKELEHFLRPLPKAEGIV